MVAKPAVPDNRPGEPGRLHVAIGETVESREWSAMARLNNWLLGRGRQLIPMHDPQFTFLNATANLFYRVYLQPQVSTILFLLYFQAESNSGTMISGVTPTVEGTTHDQITVTSTNDPTARHFHWFVHRLSSPSEGEKDLDISFQHSTISSDEGDSSISLRGLGIIEVPRRFLEQNETEYGVNPDGMEQGYPVVDDTADTANPSTGGVFQQCRQLRTNITKGTVWASAVAEGNASDTAVAPADGTVFPYGSQGIRAQTRQLHAGQTQREVRAWWRVQMSGVDTAGFYELQRDDNNEALGVVSKTGTVWTWRVADILLPTEDLSTSDGHRGLYNVDPNVTAQGSNNAEWASLQLVDLPFVPGDVPGYTLDVDSTAVEATSQASDGTALADTAIDKASGNNGATPGNAPNFDGAKINAKAGVNRPTIVFDAANSEYFDFGDVADLGDDALYIAAVVQGTSNVDSQIVIRKRDSGAGYHIELQSNDTNGDTRVQGLVDDGTNLVNVNDVTVSGVDIYDGNTHLVEFSYKDTDAGKTGRVFLDRTEAGNDTNSSMGTVTNAVSLGVGARINSDDTAAQFFDNNLARLLMYQQPVAGYFDSSGNPTDAVTRIRDHLSEMFDTSSNF